MANTKKKHHLIKNFPSIFKSKSPTSSHPWEWDWPSCKHPKTLSFRSQNDLVFKTVNSIFFDQPFETITTTTTTTPDYSSSLHTNSSDSVSATNSTPAMDSEESLETVVRGARSERLFFEPDDTSSILEKSKPIESVETDELPRSGFKESLIVSIESENPYEDFRKSMGEMVESHGVKDWDGLEELLGWYLKANWKNNHRFIIGAFVDLLIHILLASSSSSSSASTSSSSSSSLCSNSDSNYYTCTESSSSRSCSSSLRSLNPSSIRKELDHEEEDDHDHITETL
ncbi:hypothetical protein IC575_023163 [Cucumis melo]|uniref:Transcription repressor n=1 Tax=Cucumis melo TaxID=3656 RepID=A0A1S3BFU4_CUCME|nr:transcription repressor OFP13-like [Cucumis melo]